ncbi:MAG: adenosylhomocysteinase [Marine Group III euryarchaeote CG-Bathy1]|uniref:Adenosylhomocysteinase n=1 Tax=Marine Group III euryarchaeote CG-Bathy1 TaxID=1889001 RepID=A0A1J5T1K4_9ARCH|nr:MAG: adenosylhomocysteinase [Marine Group III euryarchaeote CG-Bathy1]
MTESKVADLSLADFGRREIELAEVEMPGLMACRAQYGKEKPLKGAKISGSLHMTVQTAVLIETLKDLGADLRWASCNIFSTQDHAAAAIAESESAAVFAWKRMSLKDYWDCTFRALSWPNSEGPDMLVDDGGDATLLIHEGVKVEKIYAETGELPDPSSAENEEFSIVLDLLKESLASDPQRWHKISKNVIGVSEETTTGVNRLRQMSESGNLLFSAINVNDSVTKSKFDNIYGCRHSLPDGLMRATDVMLAGKSVLICGYGDVGKGCSQAMKSAGARVSISEIDPICALQACMEGLSVVRLNDVVSDIDIFITATGNKSVITADHISQMKNNAIVANIGHFDNEIDVENLGDYPGVVRQNIKPEVDRWVFPDGHGVIILSEGRLMNLGNATGHPSFVMSASFTNQVLAQLDLWKNKNTGIYSKELYTLSKSIDEHVARLHLDKLDAKLTTLSDEQANYLGIPSSGPFKHETYRY